MKSTVITFFLHICRKDHKVSTDADDSRVGGGVSYCTACCYFSVGQNYKGNRHTHTYMQYKD